MYALSCGNGRIIVFCIGYVQTTCRWFLSVQSSTLRVSRASVIGLYVTRMMNLHGDIAFCTPPCRYAHAEGEQLNVISSLIIGKQENKMDNREGKTAYER